MDARVAHKHHKAHTDKLNEGAAADPKLEGRSIEEDPGMVSSLPPLVRNDGGGYWNDDFFWKIMGPKGSTRPSGKLKEAIDAHGGLDKLKEDFNGEGAGQFGSGWAWVIEDSSGSLKVASTANQDNPPMDDAKEPGTPILDNAVWEHACYLTCKNDRPGYLKAWWDVVNRDEASARRITSAIRVDNGWWQKPERDPAHQFLLFQEIVEPRASAARHPRQMATHVGRRLTEPGYDVVPQAIQRPGKCPWRSFGSSACAIGHAMIEKKLAQRPTGTRPP